MKTRDFIMYIIFSLMIVGIYYWFAKEADKEVKKRTKLYEEKLDDYLKNKVEQDLAKMFNDRDNKYTSYAYTKPTNKAPVIDVKKAIKHKPIKNKKKSSKKQKLRNGIFGY